MNRLDLIIDALERANELWLTEPMGEKAIAAAHELKAELAKPEQDFYPDWDMIKPFHERIAELEAQLAKPEMPTKIFGPNLEQILNAAGFYRREWVGLTDADLMKEFGYTDELLRITAYGVEKIIKDKNT
jgi:hypothetical protein